jgi:hypothetical protein
MLFQLGGWNDGNGHGYLLYFFRGWVKGLLIINAAKKKMPHKNRLKVQVPSALGHIFL